jgi:hypothetical protein
VGLAIPRYIFKWLDTLAVRMDSFLSP